MFLPVYPASTGESINGMTCFLDLNEDNLRDIAAYLSTKDTVALPQREAYLSNANADHAYLSKRAGSTLTLDLFYIIPSIRKKGLLLNGRSALTNPLNLSIGRRSDYTFLALTRGTRVPFSFQPARHAQLYGSRAELALARHLG